MILIFFLLFQLTLCFSVFTVYGQKCTVSCSNLDVVVLFDRYRLPVEFSFDTSQTLQHFFSDIALAIDTACPGTEYAVATYGSVSDICPGTCYTRESVYANAQETKRTLIQLPKTYIPPYVHDLGLMGVAGVLWDSNLMRPGRQHVILWLTNLPPHEEPQCSKPTGPFRCSYCFSSIPEVAHIYGRRDNTFLELVTNKPLADWWRDFFATHHGKPLLNVTNYDDTLKITIGEQFKNKFGKVFCSPAPKPTTTTTTTTTTPAKPTTSVVLPSLNPRAPFTSTTTTTTHAPTAGTVGTTVTPAATTTNVIEKPEVLTTDALFASTSSSTKGKNMAATLGPIAGGAVALVIAAASAGAAFGHYYKSANLETLELERQVSVFSRELNENGTPAFPERETIYILP